MIPTVGFCSGKTGVGTTSLVYHLAWLYAELGHRVLAVDLDPQVDLTARMVDEERLAILWAAPATTMAQALLADSRGPDAARSGIALERVAANLELLVGDLRLSLMEDILATQWQRCLEGDESAFHATSSFHHRIQEAAVAATADVVLVDLGPNPGPISRAALLACQHLIVPVAPDLFSFQALHTLATSIQEWEAKWQHRPLRNRPGLEVPRALARPAGYIVREHPSRLDRPARSAQPIGAIEREGSTSSMFEWLSVIPDMYATSFGSNPAADPSSDPRCLGTLKWYGSLMPMAQDARKPIFLLRPADGALGAHASAVRDARKDFEAVAARIADATWNPVPRAGTAVR